MQRDCPLYSISDAGILLDQNDDGPFKWANGPFPIQIHATFHNYNRPSEILKDPLEKSMG